MGFEPVPYFVGGGAGHSPEVMRQQTYFSTGGQEGVLSADDLKVRQTDVASNQVQILPGSYIIRHRGSNGEYQSYTGRVVGAHLVPVAPTSSSGPRTDLLMARVEDPESIGESESWPIPNDIDEGPYVRPFIITNVPSNTINFWKLGLRYSAIPLARITIPASTGTITNAMITDLRCVANLFTGVIPAPVVLQDINNYYNIEEVVASPAPNYFSDVLTSSGPENGGNVLLGTNTSFVDWPSAASFQVPVPHWATHVDISVEVKNAQANDGRVWGESRLMCGSTVMKTSVFDENAAQYNDGVRIHIPIGKGDVALASSLRGKTSTWKIQSRFYAGHNSSFIRANDSTYTFVFLNFKCKQS